MLFVVAGVYNVEAFVFPIPFCSGTHTSVVVVRTNDDSLYGMLHFRERCGGEGMPRMNETKALDHSPG